MSSNYFNYVTLKKPKRSVFDMSYENKLSCNMGDLIPVCRYDVVPGDKFKSRAEVILRFAPLLAPIMHRIDAYVHYFFVPYRLIYDDWKDFITGGVDGTLQPVFPRATVPLLSQFSTHDGTTNGSLADYLGLNFPSLSYSSNYPVMASLLPFRAYQLIYNEYYRDQNLTPEVQFSRAGGIGTTFGSSVFNEGTDYNPTTNLAITNLLQIRKRAWEKDYFTSALPTPQRGLEAIVPLDNQIPEDYKNTTLVALDKVVRTDGQSFDTGSNISVQSNNNLASNVGSNVFKAIITGADSNPSGHAHSIGLQSLAESIGFSINKLRVANAVQRFLERMNIGGSRYIEQIYSMFGVQVPDFTMQRPQYIGGGKLPIPIGEVPQTSASDITGSGTPQGHLSGNVYAQSAAPVFKHTFDEHGIVLGIMSVRPRTAYSQGLDRMYQKFDRFDYYWPQFAHLGEQAIKRTELFMSGNIALDAGDFGYQERYAEYKFRNSEVHGDFKGSLDYWHLGRKFSAMPSLNTQFVECNPDTRIFAVEDEDVQKVWVQVYNNTTAVRPIPKHVTPSL